MSVSRRGFHGLALSLAAGRVLANPPAPRSYLVASFVGDRIEFVGAGMQTGTRLDPNARHAAEVGGAAIEKVVLAAVADGLKRADPTASVTFALVPPSRLHDNPESMLQPDGVALPGGVVDLIEQRKATHAVLVTKLRDDARFHLKNGTVGRGKLRGLGYYLDESQELQNDDTRNTGRGFFAPYVYVRLSLVDVSTGKVVRESRVTDTEVVPIYAGKANATPWAALSNDDKARRLEALVRLGVAPAAETLVAPR